MQALRIKRQIDSDMLYLPEIRSMIGKNVEIIILAEPEERKRTRGGAPERPTPGEQDSFISGTDDENRQLLENLDAAHDDDRTDTEETALLGDMRCRHRQLVMEDGPW